MSKDAKKYMQERLSEAFPFKETRIQGKGETLYKVAIADRVYINGAWHTVVAEVDHDHGDKQGYQRAREVDKTLVALGIQLENSIDDLRGE